MTILNHDSGSLKSRQLYVLVTGQLGHRGVSSQDFLASVVQLRGVLSEAKFIFSSHSVLDDASLKELGHIFHTVIEVPPIHSAGLVPYMASLVYQTQQVSRALESIPPASSSVLRLRTDWIVTNPSRLANLFRNLSEQDFKALNICSQSAVEFGGVLGHVPWFANDHLMFGSVEEVRKFWAPIELSSLLANQSVDFFSRQMLLDKGVRIHPEQMLWFRYFNHQLKDINHLYTYKSILNSAKHFLAVNLHHPLDLGVIPPTGVEGLGFLAKFLSNLLPPTSGRFRWSRVVAFWLLAAVMFWITPQWWRSRLKFLATQSRERLSKTRNSAAS